MPEHKPAADLPATRAGRTNSVSRLDADSRMTHFDKGSPSSLVHPEDFVAAVLGTANAATAWMPDAGRHACARAASRLTRILAPSKWSAVRENAGILNAWAKTRVTPDEIFANFAMTLSDFLSNAPVSITVDGREKAEAAWEKGRGMIFLTSHLGHWELGGRIISGWGWPVTAVYKPYTSVLMQKFIQRRRAPELSYLAVGRGAAAGITRLLRQKKAVALLGDRPFGEEGARVRICGRVARLPKGPFLFSAHYGTPLLPGFIVREKAGHYRAIVEDPIFPRGDSPADVQELLERMASVLEKRLAQHGGQWYCFEPFWE